ncbi:uncharacterized protein I206_100171 [Kwoniella pini CBS 10737]|uniref:2-dehydropantoate 2-reductase n=1 Tax=Kwoniella pini CBS 10737 TaxID=1296096 RepID=A0A1B9IDZ0_9TREE|nr:uncharacterized protein I206_01156 [Kwoniella pini CBS 10737]OCF53849.1 hypothetical protein I206_01156 [Kwoniella pini CBS 10737]
MTNLPTGNESSSEPVDILLIGLGSIGSVYAYLLERSGKARVTAVARSNYDLYTTTGVTLHTDRFGIIENWKPYQVFKSQAEALKNGKQYLICIVCTKCLPDVLPNSELLKDTIASGQIGSWNLIQNGLGIEEDLYQAVKHLGTPVMSSPAWIGVVTEGSLVRWRGNDTLVTGLYPPLPPKGSEESQRIFSQRDSDALNLWVDLLKAGEAFVYSTDRIDSIRYLKNVWNAAWAVVTGLIRHTALQFSYLEPTEQGYIKDYFKEIVDIGFQSGLLYEGMIQYPAGDIMGDAQSVVDRAWTVLTSTARERGVGHKYSLLIDVEQNRPFEVEVIVGSVLKIAKMNSIITPRLEFAYAMLKALQLEIIRDNERKKVKKVDEIAE